MSKLEVDPLPQDSLSKLKMQGDFLNLIKASIKIPTVKIIRNGGRLSAFSSNIRNEART